MAEDAAQQGVRADAQTVCDILHSQRAQLNAPTLGIRVPAYFRVEGEIRSLHAADRDVVAGHTLSGIAFNNCFVRLARRPKHRTVLRNIRVERIHHWACYAHGAYFDDVTVTDIRGGGRAPSFLFGCVYRHVTLRGWIGGLVFKWKADLDDVRHADRYREANLEMYQTIDWALDISDARFTSTESLTGVPPHLVRRNPETQFILERSAAETILEDKERSIWTVIATDLWESGMPGVVVPIGGRGERLKTDLGLAVALRDEGLLA